MACRGQAAPSLQQMTVDLQLRCNTNSSAQLSMCAGHLRCMTPCCAACSAEAVAEANSTAFLLIDVATPRWKILFCNTAFTELTELDFDAVRGVPLWDLFVTEVSMSQCGLEQFRVRFAQSKGSVRTLMLVWCLAALKLALQSLTDERTAAAECQHLAPDCVAPGR